MTIQNITHSNSALDASGADSPLSGVLAQAFRFASANRRWLVCTSLFVLLWTMELYFVQAYTLMSPNGVTDRFAFWAPKIRLVMDFLFVATLAFVVPRRVLVVLLTMAFLISLGIVTYHHFFLRPISLFTVYHNWWEGVQLGDFAFELFPRRKAVALTLGLVAQVALLFAARRPTISRRSRLGLGGLFAVGYCTLFAMTAWVDPLDAILTTRGIGRLGVIRGYTGPWLAEIYYLGDNELSGSFLKRAAEYDRDNLTPIEGPIAIGKRLAIIQCESLDFSMLGHRENGEEVTPFLNRLRENSMFYRARASHFVGSSDADFAALTGSPACERMNSYKIYGYPYADTLPKLLAEHGYTTDFFHGNSGRFYNRRAGFTKMGFHDIRFLEELQEQYGLSLDRLGARDADVLQLSAQLMRESKGKVCHYIITLTTHTPYSVLRPEDQKVFPGTRKISERYVNCMRYLDNSLRDYVTRLSKGTTVVIFADHPTEVSWTGFRPDRSEGREYIPFFIHTVGEDLSKLQVTRDQPVAQDGSLNLLDVMKYVRAQIATSSPKMNESERTSQEQATKREMRVLKVPVPEAGSKK